MIYLKAYCPRRAKTFTWEKPRTAKRLDYLLYLIYLEGLKKVYVGDRLITQGELLKIYRDRVKVLKYK